MAEVVDVLLRARMEASGVEAGVGQIQKSLKGLTLPKGISDELEKSFSKLTPLLKDYQKQLNKGFSNKKDLQNFNALKDKISETFGEIRTQVRSINSNEVRLKVDTQDIDKLENKIVAKSADLQKALDNVFNKSINASNINEQLNKVINNTAKASTIKPMADMAKQLFNTQDYAAYNSKIDEMRNKILSLKTTKIDLATALGVKNASENIDAVNDKIEKFFNNLKVNEGKVQTIEHLKQELQELGINLDNLKLDSLTRGTNEIQGLDGLLNRLSASMRETGEAASSAGQGMVRMVDEVNELKTSTQYFFSLRNMINLLKRGIDEAVQSVKELDKAMTETAVVTDYRVSDLWGMLPEYTKIANQLGATTQGAYETMTLYYQQGLEQQQAFELGAETMKMARIAGLDYAETTDMMTAALRGFNMELNETSAKRVNDVYSELAAITASDTEELGTAMQRTASIAASAGASFEGTTAFLAQAIETTREPAENIGTAMKTIVARFQEMKKNPLEISEVDGEEVDYNKIDAALKTIGVDLKDTNGQFREFDQVMLDISAKWDTLSQSQQRYIATTAAGSRQQSRFIAMVSNYDRTMQLMEAANNSAGASDEQFGKTMDSLESKLNQLHNAWQQFTMGIANNDMIKTAVDGLTGFLNVTNKIIDTLSMGSGAIKSFLSVLTAFTGLKMAGRAANSLIGGLGGLVDPQSTVKEGLKIGLFGQGKNATQAKAITTPIVGSLSKISGQIAAIAKRQGIKDAGQKGSTAGVKETSKEDYANTKRLFSQLSGKEGFKMGDTSKLFGNLDAKHQLSMFNNSPGTKLAMKQASLSWFNSKGLSKELTNEGKQFINSIYKGMSQGQIPVDKGIELIGQPQKWGQHFGTDMAKEFSSSFARESTQQAHQQAMQYLVGNPDAYGFRSNEFKDWYNNQATDAQKEAYAKYFRQAIDKRQGHGEAKGVVSDMGRFANDIGAVADKFTQAGYGITAFGNALSQLGGPLGVIGSGIAAFGGAISTIGASISGATGIISLFTVGLTDATGAVVVAGSTIAAVAAPLAAAAGIFLLVRAHLKKVKEAGEEVTNTFKETNKSAEDNIAKLKSYKSEFATLSKGVDANGNNVSLDDSQYQRYLEIVDDIAAINPDIVEGYNAQGHAIINNNKALEETLKKQQQIKDEAYDTYTSEESLQKLINARNINNDFKAINIKGESPSVYDGSGHGTEGRQRPVGLGKDVYDIADKLRLNKDFDESSLQKYGIDSLDSLINGEEQAVKNFIKHRQQIQADLANSGLELNESIIKGFEKLGEDSAAFDEAIQPVYDNLLANVSNSKVFESIAPEFRDALNIGLKDLASQDLSASEMSKAANNMAARFANLTTGSGKYKDALDIVEKAQQDFATSLNETEYRANVQPAIDDLVKLKEEALEEGTAYGNALAEYLDNQIARISNFTEEGAANLTEALNTATDDIAAAEGALDNFNNATKTDYSTAAEGMKSIFEKTTETFKDSYGSEIQKHAEGMGDATFWTGAEALLSGSELERLTSGKNGYEAAEAVAKRIKDLEPMLREGQEGFDAFTDRVLENADAMDKLAEAGVTYDKESGLITNIPEDQWHNVAEALGISDDLLTSMLNKGRQFADISFMNLEDARKALATSDFTIKGTSTQENGQKNLYVKESTLRQQLADAGYVRKEQQDVQIEKLQKEQNVDLLKSAEEYAKGSKELADKFNDMGVKTLPDLIQTLNDTGDFTKDEIKAYADKLGLLSDEGRFDSLYSDIIEAAENPELVKQTSELEHISAQLGILINNQTIDQAEKDHKDARKELYGKTGKTDSDADLFAHGKKKDENGNEVELTAGEYEETKKSLIATGEIYKQQAEEARIKAAQTTGDEKKRWDTLAEGYEQDYNNIQTYLDLGAKAFEKNQQEIDNELAARKSKDEWRTQQNAQNWQYGNVSKANRPQGLTDENGNTVTVLGGSKSFNTGNGQEVEIAFTPVVTLNGEGTILEDDTVDAYINALIAQLQSEGKEVNLENLLKLDATGTIEGFEGIQNVIADIGPTAAVTAIQMHALEAGLDVTTINAQYQALSDTIKKVGDEADAAGAKGEQTTNGNLKSSTDVQATTYEVFTAGAEGNIDALTEKLDYLKTNYPEVYTNLIAEFPQYKELETYSGEIEKLDDKEVQQTVTASIATEGSLTGLSTELTNLGDTNPTITVSCDEGTTPSQLAKLDSDADKLDTTKTITVNVRKTGVSSITVDGHTWSISTAAKGKNNYGYFAPPLFGSAAKGYGQLGPKGKGGLTLTGELGYEVAWLPNENRSMILGANGPQMINLPSNAVVWNHEQSKEILKQKAIPAGSHAASESASSYKKKYNTFTTTQTRSSSSKGSSSGSSSSGSSSSSSSSNTTINHFSIEEVIRFNLDKKIEAMTSKIKKLTEEIDKNLKRIGTTALDITDSTQEQIKNLKSIKASNDSLVASYQKDLNALDLNKYMMQVSYTDDNGDKQDYTFDAQYYLYQSDGQYYINQNYIKKLGSPALQEAVYKAVEGALNPLISGLQKARDAADDAQKQIEDLAEKFADTFYGWENELTEIYNLTQRIENETSFTDRFASQIELELSRLGVGLGEVVGETEDATVKAISNISAVLNRNNQTIREQIEHQKQLMEARKRELDNALSAQDELDKIDAYRNSEAYTKASDEERNAVIRKLTDEYDVAANALAYIKNVNRELDGSVTYDIDWEGFEEAIRQNPLNEETYKAIKEYLDGLNDTTTEYNGSIKDTTDLLKQTYDDLKKYQDTIVDFEGDLLKGVEEQIKNDTENAKKLSDSISNALKDLLDEVKRKLDERRKQEDNAKTERDIAQKQQRLAALRANTSGGNQVEIAQLEKEIADAQQSYGRTLEDQLLDKLQQQGDEAKLQRERQIELAETSNEINAANNKELVNSWLQNPELYKEQIKAAWLEAQGYDEKGYAEQQSLLNQWDTEWTNLLTAIEQTGFNESTENIEKNTYTLVKLLADATGAVVDVTERNTETLKDLTQDVEGAKKAYSKGISIEDLEKAGFKFDAKTLMSGGYTPSDLRRAGFGVGDLVGAGITDVKTLKDAGFNDATAIKTALGATNAKGISDYKSAGFTAKDLKGLFKDAELIDLFDAKALKEAEFTASELKGKFNILQLKDAGYTLPQLKEAFKASEFGAGGISYADARTVFTAADLKNVAQYAKQAAAELQPKVSQGRDLAYGSQGSDVKLLQQTLNKLGIRDNSGNSLDVDGDFGQHTREAVINFQKKYRNKASKTLSADGVVGYYTKEAFKALGYKTGGLADYTGPAWLDGTPSKPELVLNATDTKNFLALRDVLSSAMKSTSSVANAYGGNATYEININVDKLTSDYDVDRVAERVKKIIVKDSSYRNVTQVRNFR